jgi:hypothetical protein
MRQLTEGLRQSSQHPALLKPGGHGPQVSLQWFQSVQKTLQLLATHVPSWQICPAPQA